MAHATEEMKEWSAMLQQEIEKWPKVAAKPMFGMRCYYRGKNVFGALPVTRCIDNGNSFACAGEFASEPGCNIQPRVARSKARGILCAGKNDHSPRSDCEADRECERNPADGPTGQIEGR